MDILLLITGIACLLIGLAGAVLPLPGPPLSFAGLILLHISRFAEFSQTILYSLGFVTLVIAVLDYYIPVWGTKKFGGTRYGAIGATAGMLIGFLFIPAIGIFIGTFLGAFFGELIGRAKVKDALKSAVGSFIGFLTGIVMKVILCLIMIGYAVSGLWGNI
jgi:uncharacterized protein YqgC (DUF456 family)